MRQLLMVLVALTGVSCVSGGFGKARTYKAPPIGSYGDLVVGFTNVDQALDTLGAPLQVIEVGRGLALTWGWQRSNGWHAAVSVPVGDASGSLRYEDTKQKFPGIVLFFDEDWRLVNKREGFLSELQPKRQLPRDVEDELLDDEAP